MLKTVGAGLAVVCAVNIGGVLLTASSTPRVLRSVKTLDDLVGTDPLAGRPRARRAGRCPACRRWSSATRPPPPWATRSRANASALDRACGRSSESYAADLASVNNWNVLNLACSGATIQNGLLGVQVLGDGQVAPPQLAEAQRATHAKVIIVSVGADDVEWSIMTRLCVASAVCNDKVSSAYFNQLLGAFTRSYYQLLGDLADLPGTPAVLVNEYYSPFGPNIGCLARYGLTAGQGEGAAGPPRPAERRAGRRARRPSGSGWPTRRSPATSCAPPTPTSRVRATRRRCTRPRPASWPSRWPTSRRCPSARAWSRRRREPGRGSRLTQTDSAAVPPNAVPANAGRG